MSENLTTKVTGQIICIGNQKEEKNIERLLTRGNTHRICQDGCKDKRQTGC